MKTVFFEDYIDAKRYPDSYLKNFRQVDNLSSCKIFCKICMYIAHVGEINDEVVRQAIKRQLITRFEWHHSTLFCHFFSIFAAPFFIFRLFLACFKRGWLRETLKNVDIIVDDWGDDEKNKFYGKKLLAMLKKSHEVLVYKIVDFSAFSLIDIVRNANVICRIGFLCIIFRIKYGLDLRAICSSSIRSALQGLYLKKICSPKMIISGTEWHDVIKEKSAGAVVVLMQNGRSWPGSTYSFNCADIICSLNGKKLCSGPGQDFLAQKVFYCGSHRLAEFIEYGEKQYDLLWMSDFFSPESGCKYLNFETACKAIKLLNLFAERNRHLNVAYKMRSEDELHDLQSFGLVSPYIKYLSRFGYNTYRAITEAHVVMSKTSSTVLEAMAVGAKGAYVVLSGNWLINVGVRDLGIEFTGETVEEFENFYQKILHKNYSCLELYVPAMCPTKYYAKMESILSEAMGISPQGKMIHYN